MPKELEALLEGSNSLVLPCVVILIVVGICFLIFLALSNRRNEQNQNPQPAPVNRPTPPEPRFFSEPKPDPENSKEEVEDEEEEKEDVPEYKVGDVVDFPTIEDQTFPSQAKLRITYVDADNRVINGNVIIRLPAGSSFVSVQRLSTDNNGPGKTGFVVTFRDNFVRDGYRTIRTWTWDWNADEESLTLADGEYDVNIDDFEIQESAGAQLIEV